MWRRNWTTALDTWRTEWFRHISAKTTQTVLCGGPHNTVGWTRQRSRRRVKPATSPEDPEDQLLRRARAYLATIEGAISGQRGHDRTFRAACVLVQKFGLTVAQALPLLLEWNETCEPPWSEKELLHKLQDAERLRGRPG
jgi:hypothetical protein